MSEGNFPEWGSVQVPGGERSLPVYLLIDTSGSMQGTKIESVREGLEQFKIEVSGDDFSASVVKVGVITFASTADLVTGGLVSIANFSPPELTASGVTRLDLAFNVLVESMDRDVTKGVRGGQKGDWKPVVFILTDGIPTDNDGYPSDSLWPSARDAVLNRPRGKTKPSVIVAAGCGTDPDDDETLKAISTGTAFRMGSDQAAFVKVFKYLSQSITSSVQPGGNPEDPFEHFDDSLFSSGSSSDLIRIP